MRLTPIKTEKILPEEKALLSVLDAHIQHFSERSILAISSKIVSLCEGRVRKLSEDKEKLLQEESDYFLPKRHRKNNSLTITHHAFIGSAGIDESNSAGHFVLLPQNAQKTVSLVYRYLKRRFNLKECGVCITDSHSTPLRRGASGIALAYKGFEGLKDYRGTSDLFGRMLRLEQANITDALASAAVLVMGEGDEQTPLVLIEDTNGITFNEKAPTKKELSEFFVDLTDDIFSPVFNVRRLKKGGKKH